MTHFNKKILIELLKKFEPTVLHCLCERNALITKQLARNMQLPYVLTINSLQKRWKQHSVSLKRCAQIIVPSKRIAENIAEVQPRLVDRIRQINIGTFPTETPHCFSNVSQLASIVVAHPVKNADDLANFLGAVRHLAIQGYEFMLIIIGIGKVERQLRKLLDSLDLSQITTISSRLQPWRSILAAGDIFVEPLPTDTFNPMVLEAMSVGTAVATCRGGVDDLITEDHTAVVFDHNDELSIYNCLEKLFARRELAQQLAANAQEYLRENHTVSKMITDTIETYRQAQHHRQ